MTTPALLKYVSEGRRGARPVQYISRAHSPPWRRRRGGELLLEDELVDPHAVVEPVRAHDGEQVPPHRAVGLVLLPRALEVRVDRVKVGAQRLGAESDSGVSSPRRPSPTRRWPPFAGVSTASRATSGSRGTPPPPPESARARSPPARSLPRPCRSRERRSAEPAAVPPSRGARNPGACRGAPRARRRLSGTPCDGAPPRC